MVRPLHWPLGAVVQQLAGLCLQPALSLWVPCPRLHSPRGARSGRRKGPHPGGGSLLSRFPPFSARQYTHLPLADRTAFAGSVSTAGKGSARAEALKGRREVREKERRQGDQNSPGRLGRRLQLGSSSPGSPICRAPCAPRPQRRGRHLRMLLRPPQDPGGLCLSRSQGKPGAPRGGKSRSIRAHQVHLAAGGVTATFRR